MNKKNDNLQDEVVHLLQDNLDGNDEYDKRFDYSFRGKQNLNLSQVQLSSHPSRTPVFPSQMMDHGIGSCLTLQQTIIASDSKNDKNNNTHNKNNNNKIEYGAKDTGCAAKRHVHFNIDNNSDVTSTWVLKVLKIVLV